MNTVLVADDNSDVRKLLRLTLSCRYHVLEAEDAVSALELIRKHKPAVVLLDVMMPGDVDGYQLCELIRTEPALNGIRVALVTARGQRSDIERGRGAGADAYIVKPYSPASLLKQLEAWTPAEVMRP